MAWGYDQSRSRAVIRHNGGIDDFESSLIYLPERKMTLVILMLGVLFGSAQPLSAAIESLLTEPRSRGFPRPTSSARAWLPRTHALACCRG